MKKIRDEVVQGAVVLVGLVTLGYVSVRLTLKHPLLESGDIEEKDRKMYLFTGIPNLFRKK